MLESISSSLNSAKKNLSEVAESTRRTLFSIRTTPIDKKTAAATALVAAAVTGAAATASYVVIPAIANYLNPPPPPSFFERAISAVKSLASNFTGAQAPGLGMAGLCLLVGITKASKERDPEKENLLKERDPEKLLEEFHKTGPKDASLEEALYFSHLYSLPSKRRENTDNNPAKTPPPENDSALDICDRPFAAQDPRIPDEDKPSSSGTGTGNARPALNPAPTILATNSTEPVEEASGVPVEGPPIPPPGVPASPLPVEDAADRSPVPFSEQGAQPPTVQIPSENEAEALHKKYVEQIEEDGKRPTEIASQKPGETDPEIPDSSGQERRQGIKRTYSTPEKTANAVPEEEGHHTEEEEGGGFRKRRQAAPANPDGVHTLKKWPF